MFICAAMFSAFISSYAASAHTLFLIELLILYSVSLNLLPYFPISCPSMGNFFRSVF